MTNQTQELCCPEFNTKKRDEKTHHREKKFFIKDSLRTLFHNPRPPSIGKKMSHMWDAVQTQNAYSGNHEDILILFHDPSAFKSEIFFTTDKKVEGFENVEISGTFESKVFEGPYSAVPKFFKEMDQYLKNKGKEAKKYYILYAYCPKCAKAYGHNYAALFAEV